jgi:hypothetical protein
MALKPYVLITYNFFLTGTDIFWIAALYGLNRFGYLIP